MKRFDYPTEILEVKINHLNDKGHGVARYRHAPDRGSMGKALTLTIPNTVPGDLVRVKVPNAKGRRAAHLNSYELLKASPNRDLTNPLKESIAGGTPLQYMKYSAQLEVKENIVKDNLKKENFDTSLVHPIIGLKNPNHYRNKMEFTFGPNGELGMHEQGNFKNIIDLDDSIIAPVVMIAIKKAVQEWQKEHNFKGYNKETKEGLLRQLVVRESAATGEIMVALFATESASHFKNAAENLVKDLSEKFENLKSLLWITSTDISDQPSLEEKELLFGKEYIMEELNGFEYEIYLETFFQANSGQAAIMVETALNMAEVHPEMRVVELFCGIGTFSLPFAKQVKELIGIEYVEQSIHSAKENAKKAGLDNTNFFASDARKGLEKLKETWETPDLLLINPPRGGAGGKLMRSIGRYGSDKIVYVSCNPKTLADDLKWLRDFGYELKSVQPIDQFGHTIHVESVVLLTKTKVSRMTYQTTH